MKSSPICTTQLRSNGQCYQHVTRTPLSGRSKDSSYSCTKSSRAYTYNRFIDHPHLHQARKPYQFLTLPWNTVTHSNSFFPEDYKTLEPTPHRAPAVFICVFDLFYGPVNTLRSCWMQSVILSALFLGRLLNSVVNQYEVPILLPPGSVTICIFLSLDPLFSWFGFYSLPRFYYF